MTISKLVLRGVDAAFPTSVEARAAGDLWVRQMDPTFEAQLLSRAMDSPHDPTQAARHGAQLIDRIPVFGEPGPEAAITGVYRPDVAVMFGAGDPAMGESAALLAYGVEANGAHVRLLSAERFTEGAGGKLFYEGRPFRRPDAVISRNMTLRGLDLLDRFDAEGTHVVNRGWAIRESRGKNDMTEIFTRGGLPFPDTVNLASRSEMHAAAERFGFPFVLKEALGEGGHQVRAIKDAADLEAAARTYFDTPGAPAVIASQMVDAGGIDLRWLGSRDLFGKPIPVAGLARYSVTPNEFRANTALGGFKARVDVSGSGDPLVLPDIDPTGLEPARARQLQRRVEEVNARTLHVTENDNAMFLKLGDETGLDVWGGDGLPLPPGQTETFVQGSRKLPVNYSLAEVNQTPGTAEIGTAFADTESTVDAGAKFAIYGVRT